MDIEWENAEEQKNKTLEEVVGKDTELKNWLVEYVGNKKEPEDGNVTVDMIVNTVADEFPEFLLAVAEENWIRGYEQALTDVDVGKNIAEEKK